MPDNDFLDRTPKAQAMKEKIDKMGYIKIKNMYTQGHYQNSEKDNPRHERKYLQIITLIRYYYPEYINKL